MHSALSSLVSVTLGFLSSTSGLSVPRFFLRSLLRLLLLDLALSSRRDRLRCFASTSSSLASLTVGFSSFTSGCSSTPLCLLVETASDASSSELGCLPLSPVLPFSHHQRPQPQDGSGLYELPIRALTSPLLLLSRAFQYDQPDRRCDQLRTSRRPLPKLPPPEKDT